MSTACNICEKSIHSVDTIHVRSYGKDENEALCQECYQSAIDAECRLIESIKQTTAPIDMELFQEYLSSMTWARKCYLGLKAHGFKCGSPDCQSEGGVNVYHGSFDQLGDEQPMYLEVRCEKCKNCDIIQPNDSIDTDCINGIRYALGQNGYDQNFKLAVSLLQKSAHNGSIDAMYRLYCLFGIPDWYELHWFYGIDIEPQYPYKTEYITSWLDRHRAYLDSGKEKMIDIVHTAMKKDVTETVRFFEQVLYKSQNLSNSTTP